MNMIPFVAHEADMTRMERTNRRLWILCIILVWFLLVTNAGWIYYESQFEDSTTVTQEVDSEDSQNTIVNGIGDISYGEDKTDSDQKAGTQNRR